MFNGRNEEFAVQTLLHASLNLILSPIVLTPSLQGRSQNLKAVPQNLMKLFKVDDVTTNDAIQKKTTCLKEKNPADFL